MKIRSLLTGLSLLILSVSVLHGQGYLKADGTRILDGKGNEIILRGMGLGGWMLQEGYMLQINNKGMQHTIKARIADLIGQDNCDTFYDLWLQNHMTRADVDSLAKWGFNSIRLPMHYNLFTLPIEEEPMKGQNTWLAKGFTMTDSLLNWCKANGLYLILDLHAAPGGQGKDANISDYDETRPSLWENDLNKQKTIALWRKLAERYANETNLGGYDLLNEPNWTFEGKNKNGLEDTLNQPIWDLYREITAAIREVDQNHIIIIEGNGWGNNYRGFQGPWDRNMILSFHKYWSPNVQESLNGIIALRDKFNMPIWLGESGENSDKWFTDCISLMEKNHIGWAWWPLKKINSVVCPLMIVAPPEYAQIVDYWNKNTARPSKELATKVLFEIAENLKAERCRFNKDVIDAMFRQRADSATLPYKVHRIPGRIYAADFDMGYPGRAYADKDVENTGEEGKRAGNKGRMYRNDGVDIVTCNDAAGYTGGYQVTSVDDQEWLLFTFIAEREGLYDLSIRVANNSNAGSVKLLWDHQPGAKTTVAPVSQIVPNTGDGEKWDTVPLGRVTLTKGRHTLQLIAEKGGFNLNFIEIQGR
jgi:endoglucanase